MKICIIITATIDPKGMVFTKRNSHEDRLNDYKNQKTSRSINWNNKYINY